MITTVNINTYYFITENHILIIKCYKSSIIVKKSKTDIIPSPKSPNILTT